MKNTKIALLGLALFFAAIILIMVADGIIISYHFIIEGLSFEQATFQSSKLILLLNQLILLTLGIFFIRRIAKYGISELGLTPKNLKSDFGLGVGLGVGGWILSGIVLTVISWFFPVEVPEWFQQMLTAQSFKDLIIFIGLAWIFIGPCEELFFRGALQNAFTRWRGPTVGILLTGVLFGIAHFDGELWIRSVGAVLIGIIYGVVYYYRKSLIPVIVAHSLNDTISFVLVFYL